MITNQDILNHQNGSVITFYSYKGGVGRTMALANLACLMSKRGKKVLLIDWDLEAPGLHHFFKGKDKKKDKDQQGLIDLMTDVKTKLDKKKIKSEDERFGSYFKENLSKYISKDLHFKFEGDKKKYKLDLLKCGRFHSDYTTKLNNFDWINFYKEFPSFFRTFAYYLESIYDYVLIDSRTGFADTSGICTMLMPERLVLVFSPNDQNIEGVLNVAKQARDYRLNSYDERTLAIYPLPARIDEGNSSKRLEWLEIYTKKFQKFYKYNYFLEKCSLKNYFEEATIRYTRQYAYGETIPVLSESITDKISIAYDYENFLNILLSDEPIWELPSTEELIRNEKEYQDLIHRGIKYQIDDEYDKAIELYKKVTQLNPKNEFALIYWGISLYHLGKLKEDEKLYKESFEKFNEATEINPINDYAFDNWGLALQGLAKLKNNEKLFEESFEKFNKAIIIDPKNDNTFDNWGIALSEYAKLKKDEKIYLKSIEKYSKATKINPKNDFAFNNWGSALLELAILKKDELFYKESFEKFNKAIIINPKNDNALSNWGLTLYEYAKLKKDEILYKKSIEKYREATKINPKNDSAFVNWGLVLYELMKLKKGDEILYKKSIEKYKEAIKINPKNDFAISVWGLTQSEFAKFKEDEILYKESFEKYQEATKLNPRNDHAFVNWGTSLCELAKLKKDEKLYKESFNKFRKATKINPKNNYAFNNWCSSLLYYLRILPKDKKLHVLLEAKENGEKSKELGGFVYNLSCTSALLKEKHKAFKYLEESLKKKEISIEHVLIDEDWKEYYEDEDFKKIIRMYKKK